MAWPSRTLVTCRLLALFALIVVVLSSPLQGQGAARSAADMDADGDGLPDAWEVNFGLSAASGQGDDGASGDPDRDGANNAAELAAGTHPRGFTTRYLAEGAATDLFETAIALANAGETPARALVRFLRSDGVQVTHAIDVPALSRRTVVARDVAGLVPAAGQAEFATVVEADQPLVVDRTMVWDRQHGYGSHADTSVDRPATTWYFAEGATHSGFDLFYLLQNASSSEARLRVTYLLPSGSPLSKIYAVPANSRFNIWVDNEEFPAGSGHLALAAADVSAVIEVLNGVPIIAERAMYLSRGAEMFSAGHDSAGVVSPARTWFLAEGATGSFFDLFVLIANPNTQAATVRLTYLLPDGRTLSRTTTAPPNSRSNVWVDLEQFDGIDGFPLADTAVSTTVESLNDVPLIVERAMWWPGPTAATWHEAHNSAGSTVTGTRWALAEGEVGGPRALETYYLIANTSATAGTVEVTLLFEGGGTATKTYAVPPRSRTNVPVGLDFPAAANRRFGAILTSTTGPSPARIVVERAMYSNARDVVWAAGSNAVATRLDRDAPVIDTFTVQPASAVTGTPVTLTWLTKDATSVSIVPLGGTDLPPNGTVAVAPTTTTTFTLTATGPGGTATRAAVFTATAPNQAPTAADDVSTTVLGTPVDVNVLANDADPDGDALSIAGVSSVTQGTAVVTGTVVRFTPSDGFLGEASFVYSVSDGRGGRAQATARIVVTGPPVDATGFPSFGDRVRFLWSEPGARQDGVQPGAIDPARVGVARGRVVARDGAPIDGVTVTALGAPEFGRSVTDALGQFDLAVNGGGVVVLDYTKPGWLPVQRRVRVPWNDHVTVPPVVMIPIDGDVTDVDLSAGAGAQVARGSEVRDEAGVRRATLVVPEGGVRADIELPDGSKLPAVSRLRIRATEYTIGANGPMAMPGDLPPATGYTYAVELSVDEALAAGASRVTFDRPLAFYLENFLDFPVGTPVPAGYYDRRLGEWVPQDNGQVVRLLGTDATGRALLDLTGQGQAADDPALQALGVTDGERRQVGSLYAAGTSLWRVPVPHFSPWDFNWPFGFGAGAEPPRNDNAQPANAVGGDIDDAESQACGSIIGCETQTLGEVISLTGTGLALHYNSSRMAGYTASNTIHVPLTGDTPPATLKRIEVVVDVAGQRHEQRFAPAPNLVFDLTWNGRDVYGREVTGTQVATVQVGYVYDLVYRQPAARTRSFASAGGAPITGSRALREGTMWQVQEVRVGALRSKDSSAGLGGWTLSAHHTYDPAGRVLYHGDGARRATAGLQTVQVVAGSGQPTSSGAPGCPSGTTCDAIAANLDDPSALAVAADGTLYIGDGTMLLARSPAGQLRRVANLQHAIRGLAMTPAGEVFASTSAGGPLRYDGGLYSVTPAGVATLIFDDEEYGGLGPIAAGADGSVYVAVVQHTDTVYRVDRSGDGEHQVVFTAAQGVEIKALAVAHDGALLIGSHHERSGQDGRVVERLGPDGTTSIVAGRTDTSGYGGEGLPAATTGLGDLLGMAVGRDGTLYLLEHYGLSARSIRLRRIDALGLISTVAGGAEYDPAGDDGPAFAARFKFAPFGDALFRDRTRDRLEVDPAGQLLVADGSHYTVRAVLPVGGAAAGVSLQIPSDDGSVVYEFDAEGRHLATRHGLLGTVLLQFGYADGRLISITDANGNVTTIERGTDGRAVAIVAPFGQRTTLALDDAGYLTGVVAPGGHAVAMTYDAGGLLTGFADPNGHTSTFAYGALGRLTRDQDAVSAAQSLERQEGLSGYNVSLTSALGTVRSYAVQQLASGEQKLTATLPDGTKAVQQGLDDTLEDTTAPDGSRTVVNYGADPRFGMLAPLAVKVESTLPQGPSLSMTTASAVTGGSPTDPFQFSTLEFTSTVNGRLFRTLFDRPTRTFTETSPVGRQAMTEVDAQGRPSKVTVSGLLPLSYSYDPQGRVKEVVQGNRRWGYGYDSLGQLASLTDPTGRVVTFEYDAAGRVVRQVLPDGEAVVADYDATGNVTSVTPPGRPEHRFTFSPVDLATSYTPPPVGGGQMTTAAVYDLDRRPATLQRPDGLQVGFSYDAAGRLSGLTVPTGPRGVSYNPTTGQVTSLTAPDASLSFDYNGPLVTRQSWSGLFGMSVTFGYDSDLRLSSEQVGATAPVAFTYDGDGLLTQVGAQTYGRSAANGLVQQTTLGNVVETFSHNDFGEVTGRSATVGGTAVLSTTFARDDLGRIARKVETLNGVATETTYGYDVAGRLASVTVDGTLTATYAYDPNGNRISSTELGVTTAASYDAQDRLLTRGGATFTYTAAGELATKAEAGGVTRYGADVLGNLLAVELSDGTRIQYAVDAANRRIGKRVNGALVQGFVYQDQLRIVAELDGAGAIVSRFVYGLKANVPEYMIRGGQTYRILTDHLGSPRLVINTASGVVAQEMDYDAWGKVTKDTNPGFQPFGFAGGLYDPATRLVRFGARDYDAEAGRWTAKDPLGLAASANLYRYSEADPVNKADPEGRIVAAFMVAWAALEVAASVADLVATAATLADDCATGQDKLAALGAVGPGGGAATIRAAHSTSSIGRLSALRQGRDFVAQVPMQWRASRVNQVIETIERTGRPPVGVRFGGRYNNVEGHALSGTSWLESDVWALGQGVNRGQERIVLEGVLRPDGSAQLGAGAWHTASHYRRVARIR
jgi:RHS repeat-associated protein